MLLNEWISKRYFLNKLEISLRDCKTILELGAGKSTYLRLFENDFHITALDAYEKSLEIAKKENLFDAYIVGNTNKLMEKVAPKSFDSVVAFDLIEHLSKEDGMKLIEDMTEVAKKSIIIYTPNGFLFQPAHDNNPFQEHISGWSYEEMISLGFKVYGINGHKKLRGTFAKPKLRPKIFGLFVSNLSWLMLKLLKRENKAFSILCIKTIN